MFVSSLYYLSVCTNRAHVCVTKHTYVSVVYCTRYHVLPTLETRVDLNTV